VPPDHAIPGLQMCYNYFCSQGSASEPTREAYSAAIHLQVMLCGRI